MREMVGWGNHGCAFFVCAERDESRPYGWRMVAGCVFLLARNVINHAPTAGAWHLNNR